MAKVEIYTKGYCPYCKLAKATLRDLGLSYQEYEITNSRRLAQEMRERSGRRTVPQIFIGEHHIGGCDDLRKAVRNGHLKAVLKAETAAA